MEKFDSSQCGDEAKTITPSSPLSGEGKQIIMNRCELCGIGIGKSMLWSDGIWRKHEHISKRVYEYRYKDGTLRVCLWCFEDLCKMKNSLRYIRKNLGNNGRY